MNINDVTVATDAEISEIIMLAKANNLTHAEDFLSLIKRLQQAESELVERRKDVINSSIGCKVIIGGTTEDVEGRRADINSLWDAADEGWGGRNLQNTEETDDVMEDIARLYAEITQLSKDLSDSQAETKRFKEYNNAIWKIIEPFLPTCPVTVREMLEEALEQGRGLADQCRRKLIAVRDLNWANALLPLIGSLSLSPETAAVQARIAITDIKVKLLKDLSGISYDATRGWLQYQAESLERGEALGWETSPSDSKKDA
jgi:hypothetical protein